MLSDGTGRLDIIDTGDRDGDKLSWRSVFSDLVCALDLLYKQIVKSLHQLCWKGGLNDFTDLLVEINGYQMG